MAEFVSFELDFDLTDVQAFGGGSGPQLPPGDYVFLITHVEQGTSKSSSQPTLKLDFQVDDEGSPMHGTKIKRSYSLQPQALGRIKQLMIAIGAPLDKIRADAFVGGRFIAEVSIKTMPGLVKPDGSVSAPKDMMDIGNERALEGAPVEEAPPPPPVTKKAAKPLATAASVAPARRA
jgi:hypothetical protein